MTRISECNAPFVVAHVDGFWGLQSLFWGLLNCTLRPITEAV